MAAIRAQRRRHARSSTARRGVSADGRRQDHRAGRLRRALRARHGPGLRRVALASGRVDWSTSTSGASAAASSAPGSPGSCIGGDLYTAYTFVAVPALIYGAGALGFFAVPYTIVVYPMVFLVAVRLWSVSHRHGYVTPADFVRGRHGSSALALMVALTGIVATMPYIALQLVGIEAVLKTMGIDRGPAADHRLPDPGHLHLPVRPAGTRADRVRQGHADLHRCHRGDRLHPRQARRLGRDLQRRGREVQQHTATAGGPGGRAAPCRPAGHRLLDPRVRLGPGAVPLPALDHRRPGKSQPRRDQAQHGCAAGLQRQCSGCWPSSATWQSPPASRLSAPPRGRQPRRWEHGRAAALRRDVPGLVRRHRLRCDRDRRARPGRHHVHRGSEPLRPATSTRSTSGRTRPPSRRRRSASWPRCWSRSVPCS